ncbi:MAG: hypothetical protein AAF432_06930 [Planctomycetota bacterium]
MRTIGKAIAWVIGFIMRLVMILVLPLLIIVAVMAVTEVADRQTQLRQHFDTKVEYETAMRNLDLGPNGGPTPTLYANLREAQDDLQRARIDVHAGNAEAWTNLVDTWDAWRDAGTTQARRSADPDQPSEASAFGTMITAAGRLPQGLSTDVLLVIGTIASATFGALLAGFRRDDLHYLHHLLLGVGAGFLIYLLVRGGRSVLFIEYQSGATELNAFSVLLLGLIGGLFADALFSMMVPKRNGTILERPRKKSRRQRKQEQPTVIVQQAPVPVPAETAPALPKGDIPLSDDR